MSFTYPLWHQVTWSLAQIMWRQKDKVVGSLAIREPTAVWAKNFRQHLIYGLHLQHPMFDFFPLIVKMISLIVILFIEYIIEVGVRNVSSRKKPLTITTNIFKNGQKFVRQLSKKFAIYKNYQKNFQTNIHNVHTSNCKVGFIL